MNLIAVTQDLEAKINAGRSWFTSVQGTELVGPLFRGHPTKVCPAQLLDTPNRVERYGIGFRVTVDAPGKPRAFQLNVRVKPGLSEGPKADSHPYVVMYVFDQVRCVDDEILHETFFKPKQYDSLARLSPRDWYMHWVTQALKTESGKFLADEVLIK